MMRRPTYPTVHYYRNDELFCVDHFINTRDLENFVGLWRPYSILQSSPRPLENVIWADRNGQARVHKEAYS